MGPPSKICKALGAVKDQTSISLAKVSNDTILADIDVAIVKATRHEEYPADERHVREILSLTCYSRAYISACVNTLSRRLNKTKNWVVAIKTLMLIHRLVSEGDPAYEQEIYVATRRGTRLLNLSDFRDTSRSSGSWDFSAFVRTYGLYLDERLEYRMQNRRSSLKHSNGNSTIAGRVAKNEDDNKEENKEEETTVMSEMKKKIERIFTKAQRLQQVNERFLACRPTGEAKSNRLVIIALYPIVKESFQTYYDLAKIIYIFVERFMELEIPDCIRVYEIFTRIGKQFDELDVFYSWCKSTGIARSTDYPEVDKITPKKLEVMDQFIKEKSNLADYKRAISKRHQENLKCESIKQEEDKKESEAAISEEDMKALPPHEGFCEEQVEEEKEDNKQECKKDENQKEVDLLNLYDDENTAEEQVNKLALALFDGWSTEMPTTTSTTATSAWEAFEEDSGGDWETALVQSASNLSNQKATLGGGFDMLVLDGMYQQSMMAAPIADSTGSASSVALWPVDGKPHPTMLALPPSTSTPASSEGFTSTDPFAASTTVAPPSYVQMSEMEKKQKLLVEEQLMWQQYGANGMQGAGPIKGITNIQQQNYYAMGSYT
ncbi:AP180 N-terminal homology (ANTH) domain [Macleaya cordata]|uniref:AP180 N-terminal homology (ANTH) domain n=1 Tax=Macleaya cordata TaxID=56857 RepID=A0A200R0U2_MACCD|nr:AP180 N-terminal homology (ANTH) domain [Macleaya cordata]